jgi:NADH:ubiquinone oxidoreductase subunit 5 (subunit L)/multisubunit Na+/H+ antiporter MnhA subunit
VAGVKEAPFLQWLPAMILAAVCLVFGLFAPQIPLRWLVLPAASASGFAGVEPLGLYRPLLIAGLMAAAFLVVWVLVKLKSKVREDEIYIGGHEADESYRVTGVDFYKEIIAMKPLRTVYAWAKAKIFDVYDEGGKGTFTLSGWLQKAHSGQLPLYLLFIVAGLAVFLLVVN